MSGVPFQIGSGADRTFGTKREGLVAGATVRWLRPVRGSQACLKLERPLALHAIRLAAAARAAELSQPRGGVSGRGIVESRVGTVARGTSHVCP